MKTGMVMVALLTCTLSGCGNTRLGWPWAYWEQGVWAVVGFLAVCILILLGVVAIFAATDAPEVEGRRAGFVCGVALWVGAGLLLQAMPHAAGGVQFVPLLPWHYAGWIGRIVSSASWLCVAVGFLVAFSTDKKDLAGAPVVMAVALGLNALLSFGGPSDAVVSAEPPKYQDRIARWEKLRYERSEALARLSSDKELLVDRIRSLGVRTKRELMAHPIGHTLAEELEHLSGQIAKLQSDIEAIDTVLERAKSSLRSLERQTVLREVSADELSRIGHELKEELDQPMPGSEVRLDKLLDDVFQKENRR